jgi:hypothetical protein
MPPNEEERAQNARYTRMHEPRSIAHEARKATEAPKRLMGEEAAIKVGELLMYCISNR